MFLLFFQSNLGPMAVLKPSFTLNILVLLPFFFFFFFAPGSMGILSSIFPTLYQFLNDNEMNATQFKPKVYNHLDLNYLCLYL